MSIVEKIQQAAVNSLSNLYNQEFNASDFQVNQTKEEFEGDYTIVLFSLLKKTGQNPAALGEQLGNTLLNNYADLFSQYNIIKGFLNLTIKDNFWLQILKEQFNNARYGKMEPNQKKVMVEYASPNTNKPLHLGHLRNIFLGWSVAEILKANGNTVYKSCIVNDRGIHICKSMIAWQKFGNGATPENTKTKGDHLVGEYYVKFNDAYKAEIKELIAAGMDEKTAEKESPIMKAAQQMLVDWEAGKPDVMELWAKMNGWVYAGFDETYNNIGADFDKTYYESNTYLLGKKTVEEGLQKGVFVQDADNSVWIDLTTDGLDRKIVQRKDGTSVYITQDIGLAQQKYEEYKIDQSIYVIGDEQNYHMKVLKLIAEKLHLPNAENIYHLSYGMVELPSGKMKSREGTVVDADDIVKEMIDTARQHTEELGKVKDFEPSELVQLYKTIGLGAMKFYLLRVDPKKKMIFNPQESIDFHGFTGPFVQYTYARIKSILRKEPVSNQAIEFSTLLPLEKDLLVSIEQFQSILQQAAAELNPSALAIYVFNLAKTFNSFYTAHSIANAESSEKKQLRLQLAQMVSNVLKTGMGLLGIQVPERM
ncbi:MAG TPA: arginine--tRNA ligase [Ferruginibacter sp.]|nr:arginine--tRNA ligase [Ferruginibacter sp.]HRE63898.1 arginine--tRNA ligase [Ferruginibacter sp.]